MSEILKPCPFCGGEAELYPTYDMDTGNIDGWFAWCGNDTCECKPETGQFFTEAEAIAAWNSRAPIEYDGWFYLPKPKEGIVAYGEPELTMTDNGFRARQTVDVINEAARKWSDELGEYVMRRICEIWNSRVPHGTLTAEQVEKAIHDCSTYASYDGCTYYASGIRLQAIADELNARAERTCRIKSKIFIEGEYVPCPYYEYEMECGGQFRWDDTEPPNYCPSCGAKVRNE